MINGLPYNPKSQGSVEWTHSTIRNSLLSIYLENINDFNIEASLIKVMNIYNKSIHKITKYTLNEVFYSSNEELFKIIKNNIINHYNKVCKKNII